MTSALPSASRIAGRFVLESVAGAGGMGTVYRALDEQTGLPVAIKVLQAAGKPQLSERFAREAELLAKLRHPGIVGYLAHGVMDSGEAFLAMEWLEGEVLSQRLGRAELSLRDSLTLLRRAAEALAPAHQQGVIHRDLKPSNLLLRDGLAERVAILDFGIARLTSVSHVMTRTGMVIGTPGYMAPEQARGDRDVTAAADVFSLGCVLFECLTGQPAFAADHLMAVLARIFFDEPPKLRRLRPAMPEAVEALLDRMLAKNPGERPADAAALLVALDALAEARASLALAPTLAEAPAPSTGGEQHLLCVLMAVPPPGARAAPSSPGDTLADDQLVLLQRELSDQGIRLEALADGSLVATLRPARGTATDQAARAARCALFIRQRWPEAMIALSTGRGLADEQAPAGEVFDRAAALLRAHSGEAPSSQILLDDVTRGLLEVRFVVKRTADGAYALTGEELALDETRPLLGKPTPCVGRDVELGTLETALSASIEDGEPRAVLVIAPPGAGKTRLCHEFLRRARAREGELSIMIGCGDPMNAGSSYSLLGQALRAACGIDGCDSPAARRHKLGQRLGAHLAEAERERVVSFIGELCAVPFPDDGNPKLRAARQDPRIMSDHITQAMLDLLRAECAERPLLLVLEDLHWGDALTVKLIDAVLRQLTDRPLMVLALARPEVNELFPQLWAGTAQVVPLRPLARKAGERLIKQVLGAQVKSDILTRIVEQSEGNALFLEELIRAVAEGRGDEAPHTVVAMLQARIARLPAGARQVLRAASVFGETTWLGGIEVLLGQAKGDPELESWVARLKQEEILEEVKGSRFPEEREHRFRHVLMRDAAYGLLGDGDRARAHRLAGDYLASRAEADPRALAEHFVKGEAPERALPYFLQAAERSYEAYDMDAATAAAQRGLACGATGEQRGALLCAQLGRHHWREEYAEIIALGSEALGLLPEGSKRWCRTAKRVFPALGTLRRGDLLAELAGRLARVEPPPDARRELIQAVTWLCTSLAMMGKKQAMSAFLQRGREVTAELEPGDIVGRGAIKAAECVYHELIDDAPWARLGAISECLEALRAAGDQSMEMMLSSHKGKALMDLGDREAAEPLLRRNLALAEPRREALALGHLRVHLALLLARFGSLEELDEAVQLAGEVLASSNATFAGMACVALAEAARRRGDLAAALAHASHGVLAARPFPPLSWGVVALRTSLLLALGQSAEALAGAAEAVQQMESLGLAGNGEIALRLSLAEARLASGDAGGADAMLAEALRGLEKRAADIPEPAVRERYLSAIPLHARLRALARERLGSELR